MVEKIRTKQLTAADKQWLAEHQPYLAIIQDTEESFLIKGLIVFRAVWIEEEKDFIINPDTATAGRGIYFNDRYVLRIESPAKKLAILPAVQEAGERIHPIDARHIDSNRIACLCSPLAEDEVLPHGYVFSEFFQRLVIPFFFAQTYYDQYKKWPWPEYSHGPIGMFEAFSDSQKDRVATTKCVLHLRELWDWDKYKKILRRRHGDDISWKRQSLKGFRGVLELRQAVKRYRISLD